jgi:hypothetical protein
MSLSQHHGGKLKLNLTDLWDTCLSPDKANILSAAAPQLASLYTRGSWLHSVGSFSHLIALTVDFDFVDFSPALEIYLIKHGQKLRKLVLVDQVGDPLAKLFRVAVIINCHRHFHLCLPLTSNKKLVSS